MRMRSRIPSRLQKEDGNRGQTIRTLSGEPRGGEPRSSLASGADSFWKLANGDMLFSSGNAASQRIGHEVVGEFRILLTQPRRQAAIRLDLNAKESILEAIVFPRADRFQSRPSVRVQTWNIGTASSKFRPRGFPHWQPSCPKPERGWRICPCLRSAANI